MSTWRPSSLYNIRSPWSKLSYSKLELMDLYLPNHKQAEIRASSQDYILHVPSYSHSPTPTATLPPVPIPSYPYSNTPTCPYPFVPLQQHSHLSLSLHTTTATLPPVPIPSYPLQQHSHLSLSLHTPYSNTPTCPYPFIPL